MSRGVLGIVLGGSLIAALQATGAEAYFADSPEFALRGGAANSTLQLELGPVELAIRDQLALLTGADELTQRDAEAVVAFYEGRGYRPVWTIGGRLSGIALDLIARLAGADADGLDPTAYQVPNMNADFGDQWLAKIMGGPFDADAVAGADILLSVAIAAYTRDAYAGRIDPRTLSSSIDLTPHYPDTASALRGIATAADPVAEMEGFNPTHPGYIALRDELVRIRSEVPEALVVVPAGPTMRLGDSDDRVALLRARLDLPAPDDTAVVFDEALMTAVVAFQDGVGLVADGIVGPNTLGALNGPQIDAEAEIIANMERWRWAPRDFGAFYVNVNIPEFLVRIVDDGEVFHQTRVIVGKRSNQTPVFSDEIEHMMVNPFWYVPASIISNEMMPILRSDPSYFSRNNFDVFVRSDGRVYTVNPSSINWSRVSSSQVSMRQRPGGGNALGQIKFIFPNSHAVYLHDTPTKSLFQRDVRTFSHGCVRVMDPMGFADALLRSVDEWNADRLESLFGNVERQVNLDTHIPVHITYFTAVTDANGDIIFKSDIYGYSSAVRERLGLDG